MAHDECEIREVVHDLVDQFDMLRGERDAWSGNTHADEDGQVEFARQRVERVHLLVIEWCAVSGGERADCSQVHTTGMNLANALDGRHDIGRIEFETGEEAVGVFFEGPNAVRVVWVVPKHGLFDVVSIKIVEDKRNRIDTFIGVRRNVFEHVLSGEAEVFRFLIAQVGCEKLVDLSAVAAGHADEGFDDLDVIGESHDCRRS